MDGEKVLFIGPHPDDIDLGCAISMCEHHLRRNKIKTIVLTRGGGAAVLLFRTGWPSRTIPSAAGIPGSDMDNIRFFGKVRASVKIFFATFRKCGSEILSGHPFCVSGSVGMCKADVLKSVGFSGRTSVEDMDLTWELISRGYKIAQSSRAIVYSQEAATLGDEIKRWRRWISGYAACMRIH